MTVLQSYRVTPEAQLTRNDQFVSGLALVITLTRTYGSAPLTNITSEPVPPVYL